MSRDTGALQPCRGSKSPGGGVSTRARGPVGALRNVVEVLGSKREAPSRGQWTENRATHGRRALRLDEVWRYREVTAFLALRDLKLRYKQAAFGTSWAVLQPLAGMAIFTLVFNKLANVQTG